MSPDGLHLYVATRTGSTTPVAVHTLDPTLTTLSVDEGADPGGLDDRDFVGVTPDGTHVVLTNGASEKAMVYRRTPTDGRLTYLHGLDVPSVQGGHHSFAHAVSPDARHLYVANGCDLDFIPPSCSAGDWGLAVVRLVPSCPPTPDAGCLAVPRLRAGLVVRDRPGTQRDILRWNWNRGAAATPADLGDPRTTSSYALCIYDGAASQPRLELLAGAGGDSCIGPLFHRQDCWTGVPGVYFTYDDRLGLSPHGITGMRVKSGAAANNRLTAKGARTGVADPEGLDLTSVLPLVVPVRAQLRNLETGACWDASFSAPNKSTGLEFRARSD